MNDENFEGIKRGLSDVKSYVSSTDDNRTINNAVRHQYRVLSDEEKAQMMAVKDMGLEFIKLLDGLQPPHIVDEGEGRTTIYPRPVPAIGDAIKKVQEAVFWAVWHITGDK